jgi:TonB family protein
MIESATEVIVARASRPDPLRPMVVWSAVAHVVLLGIAIVVPSPEPEPPRTRMVISLSGGAPGPKTGGLAAIGGREVQEVAPIQANQPFTPPPAPAPTMALPAPMPSPPQVRRTEAVRAETPPAPAKPATGDEVRAGSTPVETRARGRGFDGLSSAGGGAAGAVQLDVGDFCCPEYIRRMQDAIDQNWRREQGDPGSKPVIRFTIRRDGTVERVAVSQGSGSFLSDHAAERAVGLTRLPPLPQEFTNPTLTVYLRFEY